MNYEDIKQALNKLVDLHFELYDLRKVLQTDLRNLNRLISGYNGEKFYQRVMVNLYIKKVWEIQEINNHMYEILWQYGELKKYLKGY